MAVKQTLDLATWNRKEIFEHFNSLADPTFGLTAMVDVKALYEQCKQQQRSFFVGYLHACLRAIHTVENFTYRIEEGKVVQYHRIDASATILRADNTFGFSYIEFSEDLELFNERFNQEKNRILHSTNLFPPTYSLGCIHCSAIPWVHFTGHKEPVSGNKADSVPQIAFGKIAPSGSKLLMPVSVTVNHALVDGYHVGLFFEAFQEALNN